MTKLDKDNPNRNHDKALNKAFSGVLELAANLIYYHSFILNYKIFAKSNFG